ncbi:type VII secretion target [Mycobacterium sp. URHB0021]|jgi:Excreted virulence factor EspC, type VII ESX diderm
MSGTDGILKVDPDVLRSVGHEFEQAGHSLSALQADAPLGEASAAVPQLQTGAACQAAQTLVAAELATLAGNTHAYGGKLTTAAQTYETRDRESAEAIRKAMPPRV